MVCCRRAFLFINNEEVLAMEKQILLKGYVKEIGDDGVLEAAVASTDVIDRHGETVKQDGWQLDNFNKNPVLLWSHNASFSEARPPIGKVNRIWLDGDRLMFQPQFDMEDDFAKEIFRKYKDGYLNSFSVGMLEVEKSGNTFVKQELMEISAVPVPANPEANVYLRSKGMKTTSWKALTSKKPKKKDNKDEKEVIEVIRIMKKRIDGLDARLKKLRLSKPKRKDVDNMSVLEIKELALVLNKATSKLLHRIKKGGDKIK